MASGIAQQRSARHGVARSLATARWHAPRGAASVMLRVCCARNEKAKQASKKRQHQRIEK
jgi:hypothetical protein